MAIESLAALGLATAFLAGIAWYADTHSVEALTKDTNSDRSPAGRPDCNRYIYPTRGLWSVPSKLSVGMISAF